MWQATDQPTDRSQISMTGGRKGAAWLLWRSGRGVTLVGTVVGGLFSDFWFGADGSGCLAAVRMRDALRASRPARQTARQEASQPGQVRPGTYLLEARQPLYSHVRTYARTVYIQYSSSRVGGQWTKALAQSLDTGPRVQETAAWIRQQQTVEIRDSSAWASMAFSQWSRGRVSAVYWRAGEVEVGD